jgi:NADP-dependent alcohol dehydrogenase
VKFDLRNTTRIVFGVGEIARLNEMVQGYSRILLMYGGGSIKANGVHGQVLGALSGLEVHEFGGVEANPEYETAMAAVRLAREKSCDFVLGVGGGSVIDASKFVAAIIPMKDGDPWDRFMGGEEPTRVVPNGAVLTLPATGSESNPVSVISRRERALKVPFPCQAARPVFAILDPSTMKSLSRRQLENGVVDSVTHVLEQYVTRPGNAPIQIGYSEVLLQVLFEWGPRLIVEDSDEARETVMWAANQALNGLIGAGVPQDWSTHMIGHAITALYGIDHARTLTMVMPSVFAHASEAKLAMLVRYARNVWKVTTPDDRAAAFEGIALTRDFFARMGCPVRLGDVAPIVVDAEAVAEHVARAGQLPLGENQDIDKQAIRQILAAA